MLKIQNASRRLQVYDLAAPAFQDNTSAHGYKLQHVHVVEHSKNGKLAARRLPRMFPTSITFLAGETISNLPNEVLDVPAVQAAVARGELRVLSRTKDEPAAAPELEPIAAKVAAAIPVAPQEPPEPKKKGSAVTPGDAR
jgi:hypothetical protein